MASSAAIVARARRYRRRDRATARGGARSRSRTRRRRSPRQARLTAPCDAAAARHPARRTPAACSSRRSAPVDDGEQRGRANAVTSARAPPGVGPGEIDAAQEAEEQRRVAQRRQRAADVGDEEDEEHDHVRRCAGGALARSIGRISSIDAPVVPSRLAAAVPSARIARLVSGVPTRLPATRMPPATTNSANNRARKGT